MSSISRIRRVVTEVSKIYNPASAVIKKGSITPTISCINTFELINCRNSDAKFNALRFFSSTETKENKNPDPSSGEDDAQKTEDSTEENVEKEENEIESLKNELKNYKDQLLRSLAEQENTRRIAKRDIDAARSFAVTSFAKSLLETSDNLTRAMEAVPLELRQDKEGNSVLATLFEGIQMTDDGLNKAFEKNGLKKFGAVGETFDPNKHEALFEYADEKMKPQSIGQVMKVGFELNGRVIRSAEVGVIKKS